MVDRGMISKETLKTLGDPETGLPYILAVRMRNVKKMCEEVLSLAGAYREVHPEGKSSKDPAPLKVREIKVNCRRYILWFNPKQARKDKADREVILASLEEQLKKLPRQALCSYSNSSYLMSIFDAAVLIIICNMRHPGCIYGSRSIRYCTIRVNEFKAPETLYVLCHFQFFHG